MKKIMITLPGMYYGGMERVAMIARSLLINKGYDVQIVTLYRGNQDYKPDFDFISLDAEATESKLGKLVTFVKRTWKLNKVKKKLKPDIVLSFGQNCNACNALTKHSEKLIMGIRSYDWLYNFFISQKFETYVYSKADKVVSVSRLIQREAENVFSIPQVKSEYLYNPYDLNFINKRANELITEVEIPNDKFIIVSAGRLADQKGFYHLIKAISLIKNKNNLRLYILGHGNRKSDLERLIKAYNLTDVVVLMGGQANPYKFMHRADLYVMPSITEGFPNALVEAMATGTPVLSADCKSGPREILSESSLDKKTNDIEYAEYGILTSEMSDSQDYNKNIEKCDKVLANAIKNCMKNTQMLESYSTKAKERANKFSYTIFINKLITIIED